MRAIIEGGGTGDIEEDNNSHSCSDLDLYRYIAGTKRRCLTISIDTGIFRFVMRSPGDGWIPGCQSVRCVNLVLYIVR